MLNYDQVEQIAKEQFKELTDDQKSSLKSYLDGSVSEKELFVKLGADEDKLSSFLASIRERKQNEIKEEAVFVQEVSAEELDAVAGGKNEWDDFKCGKTDWHDYQFGSNCISQQNRRIYGNGYDNGRFYSTFPNCASTVEDGSWCKSSDACYDMSVAYMGTKSCMKAWR